MVEKPVLKKGLACLVVSAVLLSGLLPASASQLQKFKAEQQKIQSQMAEQKAALRAKERQKKTFMGQLAVLEDDIREVEGDLDTLSGQMKKAQSQLDATARELKQQEKALDRRNGAFQERLREIYINGQVSYLEVFFQAESIGDLLTRFDMMTKLVDNDVQLIDEIEKERQAVLEKKQELEEKKAQIASIQTSTQKKQAVLSASSAEKKQLIQSVEAQKDELEKALNEMEALSSQLAAKIRKIQAEMAKTSTNKFSGRFTWPTPGYTRITSDYGWRIHPILKKRKLHTGVDIAAPSGTSVLAGDKGTVIYAGSLGAYGNTVVVDHGGGISSMYCHLSSIQAREGQGVAKGQKVGRVGSTGWSTGPHLHFEVRVSGDPVSPWKYLK